MRQNICGCVGVFLALAAAENPQKCLRVLRQAKEVQTQAGQELDTNVQRPVFIQLVKLFWEESTNEYRHESDRECRC